MVCGRRVNGKLLHHGSLETNIGTYATVPRPYAVVAGWGIGPLGLCTGFEGASGRVGEGSAGEQAQIGARSI